MKTWLSAVALTALLGANAAQAQSAAVWRCGADGRSYSDAPCPGGQGLALDDSRSPAQVLAAQEVAARDKRLADQLVRDRERSERLAEARHAAPQATHAAPAQGAVKPAKDAAGQAKRRPTADDGTWRAVAPASRRTRG